jgi:MFS transporter, CP family, cyanate transporter
MAMSELVADGSRPRQQLKSGSLLLALFCAALAIRAQLISVGALLPRLEKNLAVSHMVAGLFGTIPLLCMGVFALPAPYVNRRLGVRAAIAWCLVCIGVFGVARAAAPSAAIALLFTVPVGVGMGLAGALFPIAVQERLADSPAFGTGVYVAGFACGAGGAAAVAVPLADAAGGWRTPLLVFSLAAGALIAPWLIFTRGAPALRGRNGQTPRLPLRNAVAWKLAILFALNGSIFYGLGSWVTDAYVERGWSESNAATLAAIMGASTLPASLIVPWLADRVGSRRFYLITNAAGMVAGSLGFILLPGGGLFWAFLVGGSSGALFALSLVLPLDLAAEPAQAGALAAMMLGLGYSTTAAAPFLLGAARDATGGFAAPFWILVGASIVLFFIARSFTHERVLQPTLSI